MADRSPDAPTLDMHYVPAGQEPAPDRHVLAVIRYAEQPDDATIQPGRLVLPLKPLDGSWSEVWTVRNPATSGHAHGIDYRENADALFGHLVVDESDYASLEQAAADAYARLHRLARDRGHPHVLRTWNYVPHIHEEENGLERYKCFCNGRQQALEEFALTKTALPAACGLGTHQPHLRIHFLAAKTPGIQIENPRQVSAFDYPEQYSPRSPAFSRALLKDWGDTAHLYISGTASIIGHESRHGGDLMGQLEETVANLQVLVDAGNAQQSGEFSLRKQAYWRFYLRDRENSPHIESYLKRVFGSEVPLMPMEADICRRELLLEIEGMCDTVDGQ